MSADLDCARCGVHGINTFRRLSLYPDPRRLCDRCAEVETHGEAPEGAEIRDLGGLVLTNTEQAAPVVECPKCGGTGVNIGHPALDDCRYCGGKGEVAA